MRFNKQVTVVIPAINEEKSIAKVIGEIPPWVDSVVVGDNGSSDRTAAVAQAAGALVVCEPRRGYGSACLRALAAMPADTDIVVFLDGDYSDYPEE
ncbi:MAG: glycosyltransferase, partial [Calditrichaeota bacterium]|nr:glycosyltransferase [Calditrichota bacterium]